MARGVESPNRARYPIVYVGNHRDLCEHQTSLIANERAEHDDIVRFALRHLHIISASAGKAVEANRPRQAWRDFVEFAVGVPPRSGAFG